MLKKGSLFILLLCPYAMYSQNNVGIGTNAPAEKLHVAGNVKTDTLKTTALRVTGGTPAAGKVLTSDGNGNAGWQTPAAAGGGTLTDAYNFGGAGAGRVINASAASVRVDGGYGLQVYGALGTQFPENPGVGSRMYFNPGKAAFRAGYVNAARPNMWNADSVGIASIAMGSTSKAYGDHSVAIGIANTANGTGTVAMGNSSQADGPSAFAVGKNNYAKAVAAAALGGESNEVTGIYAVAMGRDNSSEGDYSLTMGYNNFARANYSTAIGEGLIANSYGGLVIGRFNDTLHAKQTTISPTTAFLTIGNGVGAGANRNTVFTVLNNGSTGVNTGFPRSTLDVNGSAALVSKSFNTAASIGLDGSSSVYFLSGTGSFAPPAANTCPGRIYIIVNQTSAVKNFNGSSYINFSGVTVNSIPANAGITIISDGTSWRLLP
ncbi:MAG: hypothetical protein QM791_17385 [Ferruginibacter sp.]